MKFIYNDDPQIDLINIQIFLESNELEWREILKFQLDFQIDVEKLGVIVGGLSNDFPSTRPIEQASVFKKAAWFIILFVEHAPVSIHDAVAREIYKDVSNYNAYLALMIAFEALHNAVIPSPEDGSKKLIEFRVKISRHSIVEIVDAIESGGPDGLKILSVLLEQLVYKTNPKCQYTQKEV